MTAHLIIERPDHEPHVLEIFPTREEAEAGRAKVMAEHPEWESVLSIVDDEDEPETRDR
jgi:hypothetical protein